MNSLLTCGAVRVYHAVPLHYLAFVARSKRLLSKTALAEAGFASTHFRSTSRRQDRQRGFADYVHLCLDSRPAILAAKLKAGFPHVELSVPVAELGATEFCLCRFNIAKARYFRGAKSEPSERPANGKYYGDMKLPVARTEEEKENLLRFNYGRKMIELLVYRQYRLPENTSIRFFSPDDYELGLWILNSLACGWQLELANYSDQYSPDPIHKNRAYEFLEQSMAAPDWLGNGLEFDRV